MDASDSKVSEIYGSLDYPYYIYAPRWIESSAGIKALHFLCHALNSKGKKAFLVLTEPPHGGKPRVNPLLSTPILHQETADAHYEAGLTPVVIYSETIPGNPLGGTCVVRYLMNYAGLLGGIKIFDEMEMIYSFSENIANDYADVAKVPKPPVLFLPPIDPRHFHPTEEKKPFQVVYAGKYRSFVGRPPKVGSLPSVEVFRDGPRMQSRSQVINLLRDASRVYSFENSSIVTEAILSGTPAYFVPNEFLGEVIAEHELGSGGLATEDSDEAFNVAKKTIEDGIKTYFASIDKFMSDLDGFILSTQERAATEGFQMPITLPEYAHLVNTHRIGLARQIIKNQGFLIFLRVAFHFVLRRLSWRYWMGAENKKSFYVP